MSCNNVIMRKIREILHGENLWQIGYFWGSVYISCRWKKVRQFMNFLILLVGILCQLLSIGVKLKKEKEGRHSWKEFVSCYKRNSGIREDKGKIDPRGWDRSWWHWWSINIHNIKY